jgi:hypothetical protein
MAGHHFHGIAHFEEKLMNLAEGKPSFGRDQKPAGT